jgi:hypothetical protein
MPDVEHPPTADPGSENLGDNYAPCQEDEVSSGYVQVCTGTYLYIPVCTGVYHY